MTFKDIIYSSKSELMTAGYIGVAFAIHNTFPKDTRNEKVYIVNDKSVIDVDFTIQLINKLKGNPLAEDEEIYPIKELNRLMPFTDLIEPYKSEIMVCYRHTLELLK